MAKSSMQLGRTIAPPRFIVFIAVFAAGLALLIPPFGAGRGTMAAFDIAATLLLAIVAPLLGNEADDMRRNAERNDANRTLLLALTGIVMAVILVSVASELIGRKSDATGTVLIVATLMLAWLFSNTVYALHYAHLFYSDCDKDGKDDGGLDFPERDEPDYWDFLYFAFTLGMTFQTSDVDITSPAIRRVATGHCLAAFVFNIGVLAFTINVLGG